jgi:hypothetical protein
LLKRFCETLIPWRVLSRLSAMQYILRLEISLMGPTRALNAPHEYMRGARTLRTKNSLLHAYTGKSRRRRISKYLH